MNRFFKFIFLLSFTIIYTSGIFTLSTIGHEFLHEKTFEKATTVCYLGYSNEILGSDRPVVGWVYGVNENKYNTETNAYIVEGIIAIICILILTKVVGMGYIGVKNDKNKNNQGRNAN